jgi:uncharacterized cupredoxin-like copper-binding protein
MRSRVTSGLQILVVVWTAGLLGFAAVGCGGSGKKPGPSASVVPVTEGDFHISAPSTLKAGNYTFRVHNEGPTHHEFIVVRTGTASLPLRPDGLTVNEEAMEHREPGLLEPGAPGAVRDLTVHLQPGRYVFFCNMEGHYMAGMHTELVVG